MTITTEEDNNDFSNENQTTDYTSLEGLRTRLGIDNDRLFGNFIVKELIDNALDFIEKNAKKFQELKQNKDKNPYVNVTITEEEIENKKVNKIIVRNSIIDNDIFPKNVIKSIFNLEKYYSSKRHQHIIKRGALGDGLKEMLCIPYAFAIETNDDYSWNYPLIFNISNKRLIEVRIVNLSQVRKNLESPSITIMPKELSIEEDQTNNKFTEIVVYLPNVAVDYDKIKSLLYRYIILNTHIDFHFELPNNSYYKPTYKATQNITEWSNYQSIYHYSLQDFERLIYSLQDRSNSNIANYVQKYFREGTNIKKDELLDILNSKNNPITNKNNNNNKNIEGIYHRLKQIPAKGPQSDNKRQVPFDLKLRENALKKRLGKIYQIEDDSFVYKKINGYYYGPNNNNEIEFPYILEIIIANIPNTHKKLYFYPSINFSPTLRYNPFENRSDEDIFSWKNKKKNNSQTKVGSSIIDILNDCGYSYDIQKHNRSKPNLVMINLISPRIDYAGRNKSYIKLDHFVSSSQEIYNFCKSASPRNKNKNNSGDGSSNGANEGTMIYHLRKLLIKRYHDVKDNPDLIKTDRWTQSTVFYRLRPILIEKGIPVNRKSITGAIDRVCKNDLPTKCKRHEIGIITAARAQLYFNGKSHGVSIDEISNLMEMGTDLVIIEKEGAVEVLGPFADKYGIALLYTRGFLTEYALELSEKSGSNIVILTDFDASGLLLASKLPGNIHRIGVDFQTLEELDIDIELVQEPYESKDGGHYDALQNIAKNNPLYPIVKESIRYLRHHRIEIDSVLAKLDNNELFWDFILDKLVDIFPTRNYNRSIDVKESIMPEKLEEFITNITDLISQIQKAEREKIKKELENTDGFINNIEMKKEEIENRLRSVVENDNGIKEILSDCKELNRKHFNK